MDNKTVSNKILIGLITVITMLTAGMPEVRAADELNLESGSTVLLQKILLAHGLKYPDHYDILTVGGTPARYAAVKKGAVAAAMVTIPTSYEAKEDGLNVLANISTYLPDYQFTVIG